MIASPESLSPSLRRSARAAAAYELKFLVSEAQAQQVETWIAPRLHLDPHCDPALGNAYRVSTLYCDTPELDVYHKLGAFARRKFRLRRYGDGPEIFLERKTKWGCRLVKRRSCILPTDVDRLYEAAFDPNWTGHWFHRHLHLRQLRPSCLVNYHRVAYVGGSELGPIRLTVDRHLTCVPHSNWSPLFVGENGNWRLPQPLLADRAILELKYSTLLPILFRQLVYELALGSCTVSKYRRAVQVWGLDTLPREHRLCSISIG